MKYKLIIIVGLFFLITAFPVSADEAAIPTLPAQITGTLYNHEGIPFPIGTVVTAEVNGVVSTYTITEAGKIGGSGTFDKKFLVNGATAGSIITFSVVGSSETMTMTYNPSAGGQIEPIKVTLPIYLPSSSSNPQGSVVWMTETETPTETTPTPTNPTGTPTKQPTETESPLSVLGVFAGLGAVSVGMRRE